MSVDENISTEEAQRKRRILQITLSDEARARLEALAEERGETRSAVIEDLILTAR